MFDIVTSPYRFPDPVTGKITKAGDLCLQDPDGDLLHIDNLPVRKLRPVKKDSNTVKTIFKTNQQCPFNCQRDCDTCIM